MSTKEFFSDWLLFSQLFFRLITLNVFKILQIQQIVLQMISTVFKIKFWIIARILISIRLQH
jgi:hypothetical protein